MCQQRPLQGSDDAHVATPLPRHIPICDAHCHPTDTMASVTHLPTMRAAALTIMATRSQDQDLVADVAAQHPAPDHGTFAARRLRGPESHDDLGTFVVPAFGWHPWFSHQLYDDEALEPTYRPATAAATTELDQGPGAGPDSTSASSPDAAAKAAHYTSVLAPSPPPQFIDSLPTPVSISSFIAATEDRLRQHPHALVGEIGLDKAFHLPQPWEPSTQVSRDDGLTPGGREGRLLSPHRVRMEHQRAVLAAQLRLAGKMSRAVSVHGVQAHGVLHKTLSAAWKGHEKEVISRRKRRMVAQGADDFSSDSEEEDSTGEKPYPPRICLHSFSAGVEMLKQYLHPSIPARIFVSLSSAVNLSTESGAIKTDEVIRALPDNSILVESDLHTAGSPMDSALEQMYRHVCQVKGWALEEGAAKIAKNYQEFVYGPKAN